MILARPAHADTLDFTWQSQAWVKTSASPTQFTDGGYGGTLTATGNGTYNGPMTFPTCGDMRTGLGVLTPTADGFTLVVNRAASGPDAGASFWGVASSLGSSGHPSAAAGEPGLMVAVASGLTAAARLTRRLRG